MSIQWAVFTDIGVRVNHVYECCEYKHACWELAMKNIHLAGPYQTIAQLHKELLYRRRYLIILFSLILMKPTCNPVAIFAQFSILEPAT